MQYAFGLAIGPAGSFTCNRILKHLFSKTRLRPLFMQYWLLLFCACETTKLLLHKTADSEKPN